MPHRHLFLDLYDATRIENMYRRMHQPKRHPANPVLRGEHPWEQRASLYGTVLYDPEEKQFRMWYLTGPSAPGMVRVRGRKALGNITLLGYAISADGIHWEKPILGQVDFEGSKENNLIELGRTNCEGIAVLYDARDPNPNRRYKGFYWEHGGENVFVRHDDGRLLWGQGEGDGMWMSFSPDGVHWTNAPENPVIPLNSDTTQSLVWDPKIEKYVVFGRFGAGGRKMARAESDDALHFIEPELVIECDEGDEEMTQLYGCPIDLYEGLYVGMAWIYREDVDGTIDTSLATSRDGIHWQRTLDRQTFLPLGPKGSWEDGMVRITQRFIVVGEEIRLYYGGVTGPHGGKKFKQVERRTPSMIGLCTLRRDGFVSLDAGREEGYVLSKLIELPEGALWINADAFRGQVIAAICDDRGRPLEGFGASAPITGDHTATKIHFTGMSVQSLAGRPLRVLLRARDASIFSYWFD